MNKVILIGNLTKDPEMRQTTNGTNVCTLSLAVNRRFKDKTTGETVADFFNVIVWRQLAEICGRYLAKGRKVCVVGELQNRSYDAKDGTKRYVTEIVAEDVEFLTPRDRDASGAGDYAPRNDRPHPRLPTDLLTLTTTRCRFKPQPPLRI